MENMNIIVVMIIQEEDIKPEICIKSIIECNNMVDIPFVVYNNSSNEGFHKWASEQDNFIYAYSENGVESYGDVIIQILKELNLNGHILLMTGHHMAFPNIISEMADLLLDNPNNGIIAASYNGAEKYGLSYETFASDYMELAEFSMKLDKGKTWRANCLDSNGVFLIRDKIVENIKSFQSGLNKHEFVEYIQEALKTNKMIIQIPEAIFWWNLNDDTKSRTRELYKPEIVITIAIPTYNRGHRVLSTVKKTLESRNLYGCENIIEILVSDNASTIHLEELHELEILEKENINVTFLRSDVNKGFSGNIKKVLERSKGKYCLIHSDEDYVEFPAVLLYIKYLILHPEIACMKGRTTFQYFDLGTSYGNTGLDAFDSFFLKGNYISGIIYNRKIITPDFLKELYNKFDGKKNVAFDYYPHLFIDAYGLSKGCFASSNILLIQEGEAEENIDKDTTTQMFSYERPDSRIDQGKGYFPLLWFLKLDDRTKINLYIRVFLKTVFLLCLSKNKYILSGYNWNEIIDSLMDTFKNGYNEIKLSAPNLFRDFVFDYLSNEKKRLLNS